MGAHRAHSQWIGTKNERWWVAWSFPFFNFFPYFLNIVTLNSFLVTAENDPHEGKRKAESAWPIFRLHHQRSRYIFDMYYRKKKISRELYEWCLREKYADAALIAKWKKVFSSSPPLSH